VVWAGRAEGRTSGGPGDLTSGGVDGGENFFLRGDLDKGHALDPPGGKFLPCGGGGIWVGGDTYGKGRGPGAPPWREWGTVPPGSFAFSWGLEQTFEAKTMGFPGS